MVLLGGWSPLRMSVLHQRVGSGGWRAVRQCSTEPPFEHRSPMNTRGGVNARVMELQHAIAGGHPAAWCTRSEERIGGGGKRGVPDVWRG